MAKIILTRRAKYRKECSDLFVPYYDALCALLPETWQPCCVQRSFKDQAAAFKDKKSRARPGQSPHQYGCAADFFKPSWGNKWADAKSDEWDEFTAACEKIGLTNLSFERPHCELPILVSWIDVQDVFELKGMDSAMKFIAKNIRR